MKEFRFNLGDEVKDKVTGFKGIISARSQFLTGCNRYGVRSQKLDNGKVRDAVWFDEDELNLIHLKKIDLQRKDFKSGGSSIKI